MKRVRAECLEQTLHFLLRDDVGPEETRRQARQEYESYRTQLERRGTRYRIIEEIEQPDGSLMVWIKRQSNSHPVGAYLD